MPTVFPFLPLAALASDPEIVVDAEPDAQVPFRSAGDLIREVSDHESTVTIGLPDACELTTVSRRRAIDGRISS